MIRIAGREDLVSVFSVIEQATAEMKRRGIDQWDEHYPSREILENDIERRKMYVHLAEKEISGIVALDDRQPPEYEAVPWSYPGRALVVHRLTVHPTRQGQGVASSLMQFAEQEIALGSYEVIRLDAFEENPAALALYEHRGYRYAGNVRFRKGLFRCFEKRVGPESTTPASP